MSKALPLVSLLLTTAILGLLGSCSSVPVPAPNAPAPSDTAPRAAADKAWVRAHSRWVPVDWAELPGWSDDRSAELWPALLRSCDKPAAAWASVCAQARAAVTPAFSDEAARAWIELRLQPFRIESLEGAAQGLMTGYFEPLVEASRSPRGAFRVPVLATPDDLATRKPYWTRQQLDTSALAQASVRGKAIAYVADPLDALILQIQGSGRLSLLEPDGTRRTVRVTFAGHNGQPYRSVGRWLIDQGELPAAQVSWPAIKAWARQNPQRLNELVWANPRVVFFREEALPDPNQGPVGGQGVTLTPGRSIAVDVQNIPYGTPVWLDSTQPMSGTPLRRLVMAQDTGTAIVGAVRADYFWGWGEDAEVQAGRMKQPLRLWALWPKG